MSCCWARVLTLSLVAPRQQDVGSVDGVSLVLAAIEVADGHPVVRVEGVPSERTRAIDAEYEVAFAAWAERLLRARREGAATPPPPAQVGERLDALSVSVRDDAGTTYRMCRKAFGGTGTEWTGVWTFEPTVPADAKAIHVSVELPKAAKRDFSIPL